MGHQNSIAAESCLHALPVLLFKKKEKCPFISTHEVQPSSSLKSYKGYREGVLTPATGRRMRSSFYSHHSLNTHSDQIRGIRGEKQSTHTQTRGPSTQLGQLAEAAEPSRRGSAPRWRAVQSEGALPQRAATFQPPAQGAPTTASVPRPLPRGSAEKAPSARLA